MADLLSHTLVNYLVGHRLPRPELRWLVGGAILPDLSSRGLPITLHGLNLRVGRLLGTDAGVAFNVSLELMHSLFGAAFLAVVLAAVLPAHVLGLSRRRAAWMFWLGGLLHVGLDLVQSHVLPGYHPFYPLTKVAWELGWMSPYLSPLFWPVLLPAAWLARSWRRRHGLD